MNLLWDFDGTLFDTCPAYARIWKKVIGDAATEEEILSHLKISFSHAVKHYRLSEKQIKEVLEQEQKLHPADTPPFPNVEQVLNRANLNVTQVMNILNYYGWDKYFKEIVAGDDGFPRKPNPESYQYLHQKYILDWAIGDREIDMVPAKAIGIKTCLFRNETPGADMNGLRGLFKIGIWRFAMMTPIKLPKEQKDQIISKVKAYFEEERSETIGDLAAEQMIDFMMKELGPYIYNKAIDDARQMLIQKFASIEEELYSLQLPVNYHR